MDGPVRVELLERVRSLRDQRERLGEGEGAALRDVLQERRAVEVLHDEVREPPLVIP